jgi:hypothetical protein
MTDLQFYSGLFAVFFLVFIVTYMIYDSESIKEEYPTYWNFLLNLPKFLSGK